MADDELIAICAIINQMLDERDDIQSEIHDMFECARDRGYHPAALRKIITLSRKYSNWRELLTDEESAQRLYAAELGGKYQAALDALDANLTLDEAEARSGVSRRTIARLSKLVPKKIKVGTADASAISE